MIFTSDRLKHAMKTKAAAPSISGLNPLARSLRMSVSSPIAARAIDSMTVVAVNGEAASGELLKEAVTAAKGGSQPIVLLVNSFDRISEVRLRYHEGLRYPHLERIPGTPDYLTQIFTAKK